MSIKLQVSLTINDGEYHEDTDFATLREMLVSQILDTVHDQLYWDTIDDFKVVIDNKDKGHISISDGNEVMTHHNGIPPDDRGYMIPFKFKHSTGHPDDGLRLRTIRWEKRGDLTEVDIPPDITLISYEEGGIDAYEFLGLQR